MTSKLKTEFPYGMFLESMPVFLGMSDDQMAPYVRDKIRAVIEREHKPEELYDVMAWVAAIPIVRLGPPPAPVVGDVSGFVHEYCNVVAHYERPDKMLVDSL